jgi:acyl carrier protein phosphodiesterase
MPREIHYPAPVNWLAHLRLAPTAAQHPLVRLGTLAGDFVQGLDLDQLHPSLQQGIRHHRQIDHFVDHHPIVARSRARLEPPFRRFAGILVDIFYDHMLAAEWSRHGTGEPLHTFVATVHRDLQHHAEHLPPALLAVMPRLQTENWLASYAHTDGIDQVLQRMQQRLRRDNPLGRGGEPLRRHYREFAIDFAQLWPELLAAAASMPIDEGRPDQLD